MWHSFGSNQPDELGDRFCTDLVCLSGHPKNLNDQSSILSTDKAIATFDGAKGTTWPFVAINDPVMGGQSNSTITVKNNLAYWSGEVKIVPFLHSRKYPVFLSLTSNALTKSSSFHSRILHDTVPWTKQEGRYSICCWLRWNCCQSHFAQF